MTMKFTGFSFAVLLGLMNAAHSHSRGSVAGAASSPAPVARGAVSSGTWTPVSDPGEAREPATVTLLKDGRVLIAGGEGCSGALTLAELFDPTTNSYSTAAPLQTQREQATATLLANGKVLMAGGTLDNVNAQPTF